MYKLSEMTGKRVMDSSNFEVGVVDGINIVHSMHSKFYAYLRMKGKEMESIRDRGIEFLPMNEVDVIDDAVRLYKDFDELGSVIKKIRMEEKESYMAKDLIGMDVIGSHGKSIGSLGDVGIGNERKRAFMLLNAEEGKPAPEPIRFDSVRSIGLNIKIR